MAIEIISGLYLGNKIDSHNTIFLKSRKIKVIINTTNEIPFFKDCENLGIQCIRVPVSNEYDKYNDEYYYQFRDLCKLIDLKLLQNKNILVHCSSGKTRASTLIIAYLMFKLRKLETSKIYKLLETKYQMVSFEKNLFYKAIKKWDEELKI
jgi:protein-tyrosine phosphatase